MNKKGFTLVEILAVIVILSLVITITATKGFGAFDNTKKAITKENLNTIKEAANVLAVQIDNCDDDVDNELWEGGNSLADYNSISENKKNCSGLQEKMQEASGCIKVTVNYLITNQYLSENKDFDDIKKKNIKICKNKDTKKVVIDTKDIDSADISSGDGSKDDGAQDAQLEESKMKLVDAIINSAETAKTNSDATRTTLGSTVTEFTSISGEDEHVLNNAPDDYGTSYYFRGNVTDNYVKFADKIWRIVRINGDGTVRLVLDSSAGTSRFNFSYIDWANDYSKDNAYVGYMYGLTGQSTVKNQCIKLNGAGTAAEVDTTKTTESTCTSAGYKWTTTPYDATHANVVSSTIKETLDTWYENNIKTSYSDYIADTLFCNDKTLASSSIGTSNTALGYGTNKTYYASVERLEYSTGTTSITTAKPTFKCAENATNDYSRFTVKETTLLNGNKTNGDLKYPIGLLTTDEIVYAGAYKSDQVNTTYYLFKLSMPYHWWLLSPYYYFNSYAYEWCVIGVNGYLNGFNFVNSSRNFRPSINLQADVLVNKGNGTSSNPYVIKTS